MFAVILKLDGRTESYQFIAKPSLLGLIGLEAPDDTDPKDILSIYVVLKTNSLLEWWKMVVNLGGGSGGYICMG